MKHLNILFLLLLLISSFPCIANDGSYTLFGQGGALMPVNNDAISMKSEKITIDVHPGSRYSFVLYYRCEFTFINTTNTKQRVLMGFPHNHRVFMAMDYGDEEKNSKWGMIRQPRGPEVKNFKTFVNGKEVATKSYVHKNNPDLKAIADYDEVYGFEVGFKPGEQKEIRNTYEEEIYRAAFEQPRIEYILKSGLSWKGSIGRADICISIHMSSDCIYLHDIKPGDYIQKEPGRIEYHYRNFTPSQDISIGIGYKPITLEQTTNLIHASFDKKDFPALWYLLLRLDENVGSERPDKDIQLDTELLRKAYYQTGNHYFRKDLDIAVECYRGAIKYSRSNTKRENSPYRLLMTHVKTWEHEGESNAPCYYIAYNLCCACSLMGNIEEAFQWLEISLRMHEKICGLANNDKDLKALGGSKLDTLLQGYYYFHHPEDLSLGDTQKYFGLCDIHEAIDKGIIDMVDIFISPGRINTTRYPEDWAGAYSPLYYAILERKTDIARLLIEKGADVNLTYARYNTTPLMIAAYQKNLEIAELLISRKALMDVRDFEGKTALHYALDKGAEEICIVLINSGCNIELRNNNGKTPLMMACMNGWVEVVRLLLKKGADITKKDHDGKDALAYAKGEAYPLLISAGIDINEENIQEYFFNALQNNNTEFVKYLFTLHYPIDVNKKDEYGRSSLHIAVLKQNDDIIKLLIEKGVNPENDILITLFSGFGVGSLKKSYQLPIVKLLIDSGLGDITYCDEDGKTVLHIASTYPCSADAYAYLLEQKEIDVNRRDNNGNTALHTVALSFYNHYCPEAWMYRLLVEHGADISITNKEGKTVLYILREKKNTYIEEYFKDF